MKKKIIYLIVVSLIFISGCSSGKVEKKATNDDNELKGEYRASMIAVEDENIANSILEMINNDYKKSNKSIDNIFCEYAKKYSIDYSKDDCGDIGYFNSGTMVEEFEIAVKQLQIYEYTKTPVYNSDYELYYIILRTQ